MAWLEPLKEPEAGQPNSTNSESSALCDTGNNLQMPSGLVSRTFWLSEMSLIMRQNPQHSQSPDSLRSNWTASGSHKRRENMNVQVVAGVARQSINNDRNVATCHQYKKTQKPLKL